jgi:hypothetical protein
MFNVISSFQVSVVNGTLTVSPYATLNVNLNNNTISGTPYNGITVDNYNSVKSNFVIADHAAVNINSDVRGR